MLIPIVPSVPKRRRGHAACAVRVARVDLMDLSNILGVGRGRVGGDGCVMNLGLAVVVGDDREGWVCDRGGGVDEVGGEVECLTGVCTTGVDDEMGAVTRRRGLVRGMRNRGSGKERKGPVRLGARWCAAAELVVRAGRKEKKEGRQRALQGPRAIGTWASWNSSRE